MYIEYNELLKQFKKAERNYNEALEKKSELILSVMPGAVKPKEVMVTINTSPDTNLINYTSEIDEVDKLINQSRNTRDMLNYELKKNILSFQYKHGKKDHLYHSYSLAYIRCF